MAWQNAFALGPCRVTVDIGGPDPAYDDILAVGESSPLVSNPDGVWTVDVSSEGIVSVTSPTGELPSNTDEIVLTVTPVTPVANSGARMTSLRIGAGSQDGQRPEPYLVYANANFVDTPPAWGDGADPLPPPDTVILPTAQGGAPFFNLDATWSTGV